MKQKTIRVLRNIVNYVLCRYVPMGPDGLESVFVGGDRLTEGNSRNVQWTYSEAERKEDTLEGLVFKFEDWHAIKNLFEVCHLAAYYRTTFPKITCIY